MCFKLALGGVTAQVYIKCIYLARKQKNSCRVHVHNVQVCYICILVPCCCAAPINSSFTIKSKFQNV
uniref:Uncharacterized protein n=1 Tax=Macaca fascicularis TaxID=9541 RepID=A0A7N9IGM6_MACFA